MAVGEAAAPPRVSTTKQTPRKAAPAAAPASWQVAVRAAESKKASASKVLDLREITSFADFFLICTGANQRQIQAICDEIEKSLKEHGERPINVEGYGNAEWVLMDYGDLVVHVFSPQARSYYDIERLWRDAKAVTVPA
jgi:ribosome-associated protein